MSGVGGVVYDKDAVYIDLGGSHSYKNTQEQVQIQFDLLDLFDIFAMVVNVYCNVLNSHQHSNMFGGGYCLFGILPNEPMPS